MEQTDTGMLGITTKHLYFRGVAEELQGAVGEDRILRPVRGRSRHHAGHGEGEAGGVPDGCKRVVVHGQRDRRAAGRGRGGAASARQSTLEDLLEADLDEQDEDDGGHMFVAGRVRHCDDDAAGRRRGADAAAGPAVSAAVRRLRPRGPLPLSGVPCRGGAADVPGERPHEGPGGHRRAVCHGGRRSGGGTPAQVQPSAGGGPGDGEAAVRLPWRRAVSPPTCWSRCRCTASGIGSGATTRPSSWCWRLGGVLGWRCGPADCDASPTGRPRRARPAGMSVRPTWRERSRLKAALRASMCWCWTT